MSEQQNIEFVQSLYQAFGRGDVPFILSRLADDVDWIFEGPAILPFAGKRRGPAQVMQFFQALATTQTNQKLTMETLVGQGDVVVGIGRYAATVKATGKSFDARVAHYFVIANGKVTRFEDIVDTAAMADAYAGASAAAG